jgi:hypothetical protein
MGSGVKSDSSTTTSEAAPAPPRSSIAAAPATGVARSTGTGCVAGRSVATAAAAPSPRTVAAPATRVARPARAASQDAWCSGASTYRNVNHAGTTADATTSEPTSADSGSPGTPNCSRAPTSSGQCHRYSEYDRPPTNWADRPVSRRPTRSAGRPVPAAITAAVPSVGSAAADPGNGVCDP